MSLHLILVSTIILPSFCILQLKQSVPDYGTRVAFSHCTGDNYVTFMLSTLITCILQFCVYITCNSVHSIA